jgi:hypothetical protein
MTNEATLGNEWAAYGVLDTYNQDETRESLQRCTKDLSYDILQA